MTPETKTTVQLPTELGRLFWDCDFARLDLARHRSFIIRRIADQGDWAAILWLRRNIGDAAIHDWFLRKAGAGLDPRQLRFWGVILDLPRHQVDQWVQKARSSTWHARCAR